MKNWSYISWSFSFFLFLIISCNQQEVKNKNLTETFLIQYLSQEKIPLNSVILFTGTKEKFCGSCVKASNTILLKLTQDEKADLNENISIILLGSSEKTIRIAYSNILMNKSYVFPRVQHGFMKHKVVEEKPRVYFFEGNKLESFIDIDEGNINTIMSKIYTKL